MGLSQAGGKGGIRDIWCAWVDEDMRTGFWWENLRKIIHLENL